MNLFPSIPGYTEYIVGDGREPAFVMMLGFLLAFIAARSYTRAARIYGWRSAFVNGVHTHHLVFGVLTVLLAGALQISIAPEQGVLQLSLATLFGMGAALVLDEFALLFHLKDVYWEKEGRKSVDAVIIATILGILFLMHITPFNSTQFGIQYGVFILLQVFNMIFVIITALKGKFRFAIFGVFVPVVAQVGALRLAEPGSIWTRVFYAKHSKKRALAVKRYANYEKRWNPKKEKLWDYIGGQLR